jgi:hypothetical protein
MSEYGVTEFGRFASEYKALFGERPSETVARSRVQSAMKRCASAGVASSNAQIR